MEFSNSACFYDIGINGLVIKVGYEKQRIQIHEKSIRAGSIAPHIYNDHICLFSIFVDLAGCGVKCPSVSVFI